MGIGASIFLIALGAIFAFAVEFDLGWIDLSVVGWVLILAGLVGLITTMWFWQSRRRPVTSSVTERRVVAPPPDPGVVGAPPQPPVSQDPLVEEQYRVRRDQY